MLACLAPRSATSAGPDGVRPHLYEGFGAVTRGGNDQPVYRVTTLDSAGPGSLADALAESHRYVVFDVGGVIPMPARLFVKAHVTIDGFTAPAPGITLEGKGLRIDGRVGAHDIIVRGLRIKIVDGVRASEDGISILKGAFNVVIDHCHIAGASDENIGINDARDITISWSILGRPIQSHSTNLLVYDRARRISLHHNLFFQARRRNPWVAFSTPQSLAEAPEIQADIRNNLMWDVSGDGTGHGTVAFAGAKVNVVNNYYRVGDGVSANAQQRAIVICADPSRSTLSTADLAFCAERLKQFPVVTRAYVAGNVSADGWTDVINAKGTESAPFPAAAVGTDEAVVAARQVLAQAGTRAGEAADLVGKQEFRPSGPPRKEAPDVEVVPEPPPFY